MLPGVQIRRSVAPHNFQASVTKCPLVTQSGHGRFLRCTSPLLAQSRHPISAPQCLLSGKKRTWSERASMSVHDPKQTFARQTLQGLIISSGGTYAANDSPAIWRCARAQPRASATARWSAIRRTDAPSGAGNHVINYRRMHVGDAMMMFGRGPGRECGDKNNCNGKRNFCLTEHFCISWLSFATVRPPIGRPYSFAATSL